MGQASTLRTSGHGEHLTRWWECLQRRLATRATGVLHHRNGLAVVLIPPKDAEERLTAWCT